jgi:hypothetical protein
MPIHLSKPTEYMLILPVWGKYGGDREIHGFSHLIHDVKPANDDVGRAGRTFTAN